MTQDLRTKLRPLLHAIVEPLLEQAIAAAEQAVRDRFELAFVSEPAKRSATTPPRVAVGRKPIAQKRKQRVSAKVSAHRNTKPANVASGSPKEGGYRCKVCGEAGHNARRHKGETPASKSLRIAGAPSAVTPGASKPRTPSQQRRDAILARTAAGRAELG